MELLSGGGIVLFFKVLGALSGYIFAYFVANRGGAGATGVYELAATAFMIITVASRFGLDGALVKYISEYHATRQLGKIRHIYSRSTVIVLAVSSLLGLIFYFYADELARQFGGRELAESFRWVAIFTPLFSLFQLNAEAMRGLKLMKEYSLMQNATIMSLAAVFFLSLYTTGDVGVQAVQAYCWSILVLTLWSYWLVFRIYRDRLHRSDAEGVDMKNVVKTALPMFISGTLFLVISWTDTLMVGYFWGDTQVGIYRIAFKIATLITFAQFAINSIAAPMISSYHAGDDLTALKKIMLHIGRLNTLMSTPIFLILIFFPGFVSGMFGTEFTEGSQALVILAVGQLVNALCGPVMYTLNMTGKEKVSQRIMLISAGLNVVLNAILIPTMGIVGAAWATTVSMTVWNIVAGYLVYKYYGIITVAILGRWIK